jgi:ABC-type transport system substrate-binding protein
MNRVSSLGAVLAILGALASTALLAQASAPLAQAPARALLAHASAPAPLAHASAPAPLASAPQRAGGASLVATLRSEPRSFNPIAGRDFASSVIAQLAHARLVRINRATQQLEPWLAEKYGCTANGLTCTLNLRRGVRFSDGAPFTSADVLFSFQAIYDEKTGSWIAEVLTSTVNRSRSLRQTPSPSS